MNHLKIKYGNYKLPKTTMIFNMGTAKDCPSRVLNLCEVCNNNIRCYAEKAEIMYPNTVPAARKQQEQYWKTHTAEEIIADLERILMHKKNKVHAFRFNESGAFWSQLDIDKLAVIALYLKNKWKIVTYGFTARTDLSFENVPFLVKGSGKNFDGSNGYSVVIQKQDITPKGFYLCPGDCKKCNMCLKKNNKNIAFRKH